jgi:hypothetical protein
MTLFTLQADLSKDPIAIDTFDHDDAEDTINLSFVHTERDDHVELILSRYQLHQLADAIAAALDIERTA